jgi:hypothetical protein
MVGNQWLTHVKEWAGDDGHMSRNSRRTMDIIILGTMGTTLGNDGSIHAKHRGNDMNGMGMMGKTWGPWGI